jgi:hypothetical protein
MRSVWQQGISSCDSVLYSAVRFPCPSRLCLSAVLAKRLRRKVFCLPRTTICWNRACVVVFVLLRPPPPPVSTLSRAPSSPSTLSHYFPLIICGCLLSRPCPFVAAGSTAISACRRRPDSLLHRPGPAAIPCAGQGRGWLGGSGVHRCAAIAAATVPCQHPGVRRRCVQSHAL